MGRKRMSGDQTLTRRRLLATAGLVGAGAVGSGCVATRSTQTDAQVQFLHGVASGDPLADRVILWTRLTPSEAAGGPIVFRWEVAEDDSFATLVAAGEAETSAERDWTAKVDAGGLSAGTEYRYRFVVGSAVSPVGRTKTLPVGRTEQLRIAAFSCSNYPFGFFRAYRHFAEGEPVDVALHLGDYFYEYGSAPDDYGAATGATLGRNHEPGHETITLADYRQRHAQYKSDPDLQAAHAAAPWITIWDDHESANNATRDGAENHDPSEGEWSARKRQAIQAYFEWMPIREPEPGRARSAIWRSFEFGDLASLIMLETRLTVRSDEITIMDLPIPDDAVDDDGEVQAGVDAYLRDVVGDPARELLGPDQLAMIAEVLSESRAAGKPWQVFGNQVIMSKVVAPNFTTDLPAPVRALAQLDPLVWSYMLRTRFNIPINLDAWDGFPAERERLFAAARDANANMLVLTGDTHNFWANTVRADDGARMGAEFGATSVTSASAFEGLRAPGLHAGRLVENANRDVLMHEPYDKGYLVATLSRSEAIVECMRMDDITAPDSGGSVAYRFRATPRTAASEGALERLDV